MSEQAEEFLSSDGEDWGRSEGRIGSNPTLEVVGACPGQVEMIASGVTPLAAGGLYQSEHLGQGVLTGGPCDGTQVELENSRLVIVRPVDLDGVGTVTRNLNQNQCGIYVQLVDSDTCLLSQVVQLPEVTPDG